MGYNFSYTTVGCGIRHFEILLFVDDMTLSVMDQSGAWVIAQVQDKEANLGKAYFVFVLS